MKWSDGQPATCEDARFTYQFVLDVQAADDISNYVGSGYLEPYVMNAGLKAVTCTDPQTLVVTTEFGTTLLTQAYVPILPKRLEQYTAGDRTSTPPGDVANNPPVVGSGPYVAVGVGPGPVRSHAAPELLGPRDRPRRSSSRRSQARTPWSSAAVR
jgi:ABC-type transport system substrate-binding protein